MSIFIFLYLRIIWLLHSWIICQYSVMFLHPNFWKNILRIPSSCTSIALGINAVSGSRCCPLLYNKHVDQFCCQASHLESEQALQRRLEEVNEELRTTKSRNDRLQATLDQTQQDSSSLSGQRMGEYRLNGCQMLRHNASLLSFGKWEQWSYHRI